jgi:hypothetical protein
VYDIYCQSIAAKPQPVLRPLNFGQWLAFGINPACKRQTYEKYAQPGIQGEIIYRKEAGFSQTKPDQIGI